MLRAAAAAVLFACACAAGGAAFNDAHGAPLIFTGGQRAIWIVRGGEGNAFDVVSRPAGKTEWQWVLQAGAIEANVGLSGATAVEGRIHLLYEDGQYLLLGLDGTQNVGRKVDSPHWPASPARVILLSTSGFGKERDRTTVAALVARPTPTEALLAEPPPGATAPAETQPVTQPAAAVSPATAPATRPVAPLVDPGSHYTLGVFQYAGGEWTFLGDVRQPVPAAKLGGVTAVAIGPSLYVHVPGDDFLLSGQLGQGQHWQRVALGDELGDVPGGGEIVSLHGLHGQLAMVLVAAERDGRRGLHLALRGETWHVQPIRRDGGPATFPPDALPLIARLGDDQIALLSRGREAAEGLKLATVDLNGVLTDAGEVSIFDEPPRAEGGEDVLDYFMWGILAAILVPMFLLRPRPIRGPFILPMRRRPGNLLKRLVAAVIDFTAWGPLAALLFAPPLPEDWPGPTAEGMQMIERYMGIPEVAYTAVAASLAYVAYGIVMEMRFGATVGKMVMQLRVVNDEGGAPNLREAWLRNIVKLVELSYPLLVPFMVLVPILSRYRQRLGDMLARTAVIDARYLGPPPTDGAQGPPGGPPTGEGPREPEDDQSKGPEGNRPSKPDRGAP